ncbi:uncharacterized protein LOC124645357 [Helicoverpa zea]|uniref:uncharacterized protein LOC124645357 n=1 Tax=Helicoverpa zea TaxID=7113 RepID=UPI001F5918E6|nr:uncharacterized protein LOC124645357 [Helicoverpa zea]
MFRSPSKAQSDPNLSKDDEVVNVTQRKRKQPECELTLAISALSDEVKKSLNDLRVDINSQFSGIKDSINTLRSDLNAISSDFSQMLSDVKALRLDCDAAKTDVTELKSKYSELSREVSELKSTVNFNAENNIDGAKRIADMELKIKDSGAAAISLLEGKIDKLEQQARQCNIEICNVPEKRGENLSTVLESIASAINMTLSQRDIIAIHRVPHAHSKNTRPKNIIVKFATRLLRDNMLSAYRLSRGLTSDRIGISGTPIRVYMNEHLTLRNKDLFRKCREAAQANKFKYVWIRNATILVKEMDDSATFAIHTESDISTKINANKYRTETVTKT